MAMLSRFTWWLDRKLRPWVGLSFILILVTFTSGCVASELVACGDRACPASDVCIAGACVNPVAAAACDGRGDGESCASATVIAGYCVNGACVAPICGDGVRVGDEACDDGNTSSLDGCSSRCDSDETCGNRRIDELLGEQCDDGNRDDADGCHHDCRLPRCGDGVLDLANGEVCDVGASNSEESDAACRTNCQARRCGDGVLDVDAGEVCDDGNLRSGDGCSGDCLSRELCGNGYVDVTLNEECDDGNLNDADGCHQDCLVPRCGDYVVDRQLGEACDLGTGNSDAPNEGCRTNCQLPRCSDGIVDDMLGEVCDDGNLAGRDGCSGDCLSDESCGNGYVDVLRGEQCDDGNDSSQDTCNINCNVPRCGDEEVNSQNGEACDRGVLNSNDPDAICRPNCQPRRCGDGVVDSGEICDDGNLLSNDDCSGDCLSTEVCGNGHLDAGRGEQCDDKNGSGRSGDGCSSTCLLESPSWTLVAEGYRRSQHTVAYDSERGVAVVFGGSIAPGVPGAHGEIVGNVWRAREFSSRPSARSSAAMTYDSFRRRMVLFGGTATTTQAETWTFDGVRWQQYLGGGPPALSLHSLTFDDARRVVVLFGGLSNGVLQSEVWEYGDSWQRRVLASGPSARLGHAMAYNPHTAKHYLFGGVTSLGANAVPNNELWQYDGNSWIQRSAATMPPGVVDAALVYDRQRRVFVLVGGMLAGGTSNPNTWEYDPATNSWLQRSTFGGGGNRCFYDTVQALVTCVAGSAGVVQWIAGRWYPVSIGPAERSSSAIVDTPWLGGAFMFGGNGASGAPLSDGWRYLSGYWEPVVSSLAPPGRYGHAMVAISSEQAVLLFGGFATDVLGDTWKFVGGTWQQLASASAPSARVRAALAYDMARQRVVLFGGWSGSTSLADTWEFDGTAWVERTFAASPGARSWAAMAYDERRRKVVLFGGQGNVVLGDTWEYDGAAWTRVTTPLSPSARAGAKLVYHKGLGRLVMVGSNATAQAAETWEYDGASWRPAAVSDRPTALTETALSYVSLTGEVVRFGGTDGLTARSAASFAYTLRAGELGTEACFLATADNDGDGFAGCTDPDCSARCTPYCAPFSSCDSALPHCGDGVCDTSLYREDYLICPSDCPAP